MKDKKTLISIIVLLAIFLPMAIYGTIHQIGKKTIIIDNNPNKEFIYNNKVYYYQDNNLLNTYTCTNECSALNTKINDTTYGIHYYKKGTKEAPSVLKDGFAIFQEGSNGVLYNFSLEKKIIDFEYVKTYDVDQTSPIIMIGAMGKMGVVSLDTMAPIIPIDYDFIGIPNRVTNGVLDTSHFIAKNGTYWYVLESDGTYNHEPFRETIIDFNANYVVVDSLGLYKIYDYTNERNQYLKDFILKDVYCVGDYIAVITQDNTLSIYKDLNAPVIDTQVLKEYTDIDFEYLGNKIDVYLDNNLQVSIVLD